MTATAEFLAPRGPGGGRSAALWLTAAAVAIAAHGSVVLWTMRAPPIVSAPAGAPAVMIDLAPPPSAPEAADMAPGDAMTDEPEILETVQEEIPEQTPPDMSLPEADVAPPEPPSPLTAPPALLPEVALPAPTDQPLARPRELKPVETPPEPTPDPKPVRKTEKPKTEAPPEKEAPRQAQTRAASTAPSTTNRPSSAGGGGGGAAVANWQSRVMAQLERRKRYPSQARSRKEEGTATVRFSIDDAGNVTSSKLVRSSGSALLDEEAVALPRRASPLPPPPPGVARSITAPIHFNVR